MPFSRIWSTFSLYTCLFIELHIEKLGPLSGDLTQVHVHGQCKLIKETITTTIISLSWPTIDNFGCKFTYFPKPYIYLMCSWRINFFFFTFYLRVSRRRLNESYCHFDCIVLLAALSLSVLLISFISVNIKTSIYFYPLMWGWYWSE